jgi:hypothetical protein
MVTCHHVDGVGMMMKENGETVPEVDAVVSKPPRFEELNDLLQRISATNANPIN